MKYMKLFEAYTIYGNVKYIVNWDMVEDIKDMALEYIDEGFSLVIWFMLFEMPEGLPGHFRDLAHVYGTKKPIMTLAYNHKYNTLKYNNDFNRIVNNSNKRVIYDINLIDDLRCRYVDKNKTDELRTRVRETYRNQYIESSYDTVVDMGAEVLLNVNKQK